MNNKSECLIFLHIPKTAGSTFHTILSSRYCKKNTYNVFGSRYSEPEIKQFIELSLESKKHIRLLKGHMPFGLHKYINLKGRYISILRDPAERVISQYYYIKKNSYNPLHAQVEGGNMSIKKFVSSGISIGMNNGQCRFLNGDLDAYGFNECNAGLLDQVKKNINEHFLWLGVTERFDESILLLSKLMGWKKLPCYIRSNVSNIRKPKRKIGCEDMSVIEQFNSLDIQLYKYVNKLLDKQIAKIDGFNEELILYKEKNNKLKERWEWLPDKFRRFIV